MSYCNLLQRGKLERRGICQLFCYLIRKTSSASAIMLRLLLMHICFLFCHVAFSCTSDACKVLPKREFQSTASSPFIEYVILFVSYKLPFNYHLHLEDNTKYSTQSVVVLYTNMINTTLQLKMDRSYGFTAITLERRFSACKL